MSTPESVFERALLFCAEAHRGAKRKLGSTPYILHPMEVATIAATLTSDEEILAAALLHDVIEDTPYTLDDLRAMGFNEQVLDALALMTHDKRIPYMDYVAKIKGNKIARTVKLADLKHNSDLSRLNNVDEKAMKRIEKYRQAIALLSEHDPSCQR